MAEFQHPFQCVQFVKRKAGDSNSVLVAAAGAKLFSYAAENGQRLSVWPQDGPPEKKRKVDPSEQSSVAPAKKPNAWTSIPILTPTPDGEYLVALTGEDKCIRVFQIEEDGSFEQLSARPVPKRPCAITFMDNNDILLGDKFGDVYSMPLIPSTKPRATSKYSRQEKPKKLAATNLTVHTQRNLRSLEMQKQQRASKNPNKVKENNAEKPTFDVDLLLGHVSLLTDVAFVSLSTSDPSSTRKRSYILSADRDEHIRVSRGPPQAHIIENHCFGHTAFITKLCIPAWAPEIVISGGGDPYLLVWNWTTSQILHKILLVKETPEATANEVVVRGIWAASFGSKQLVFVALEGQPDLQTFTLDSKGTLTPEQPLKTTGNILDIQPREDINTVLISVDNIRQPGSTQEWRSSPSPAPLLEAFQLKPGTEISEWTTVSDNMLSTINASNTVAISATTEGKDKTALNNSLYGLENLRKKAFGEDDG
ncbi:hypothetical protein BJX99DRAFT_219380 [Aspergillus californicus]